MSVQNATEGQGTTRDSMANRRLKIRRTARDLWVQIPPPAPNTYLERARREFSASRAIWSDSQSDGHADHALLSTVSIAFAA